jgi:hypothetical protein
MEEVVVAKVSDMERPLCGTSLEDLQKLVVLACLFMEKPILSDRNPLLELARTPYQVYVRLWPTPLRWTMSIHTVKHSAFRCSELKRSLGDEAPNRMDDSVID